MRSSSIFNQPKLGIWISQESKKDYGIRIFSYGLLGIYLLGYFFLLRSVRLDVSGVRFLINSGAIVALVLFLFFYTRFSLKSRTVFLTLVMFIPSLAELFSLGLLSFGKTVLFVAPILLAIAFDTSVVFIAVFIASAFFLIAAYGFSFGILNPPEAARINRPIHLILDTLTMLSFSIAYVMIIHQLRNRLISFFRDISKKNTELQTAEKSLIDIRNELSEKINERVTELDEAREMLLQAKEKLEEHNRTILSQKAALEATYLKIQTNQANLMQSRKMASLGSLSLGIAHEINNPLNFIQGALLVLEKKMILPDQQEMSRVISIMQDATKRINKIVKSLYQFGPGEVQSPVNCDLISIIENCFVLLKPQLHGQSRLEIQKPDVVPVVKGFSEKLHQVFLNILHNAIQAVQDDGKIEVSFIHSPGSQVIITRITDNGPGIPPELLEKITDPFFTTKPMGQGTGLGLYITKQIINDHHGQLSFRNAPGRGTIVEVELPAA